MGGGFLFLEVVFLEDPSETKIQNHSHEICLEKLVCMLPRGDAPSGWGWCTPNTELGEWCEPLSQGLYGGGGDPPPHTGHVSGVVISGGPRSHHSPSLVNGVSQPHTIHQAW